MRPGARTISRAIGLYLDQHNGKDGNPTVEVIYRDVGGDNPPRARQLAQELIVRDKVAVLGGLEFTTTVLAIADVINRGEDPVRDLQFGDRLRHRQVALLSCVPPSRCGRSATIAAQMGRRP